MAKTAVRIDHIRKEIIMYKWFEKKARYAENKEYFTLINYTKNFPNYSVVVRKDIKRNTNKESYKGLTYDYMRNYIITHESEENVGEVLAELEDKIFISKCHSDSYRYPVIKKWFLDRYKEVATYGIQNSSADEYGEPLEVVEELPKVSNF